VLTFLNIYEYCLSMICGRLKTLNSEYIECLLQSFTINMNSGPRGKVSPGRHPDSKPEVKRNNVTTKEEARNAEDMIAYSACILKVKAIQAINTLFLLVSKNVNKFRSADATD
jgi:hypothetical protein